MRGDVLGNIFRYYIFDELSRHFRGRKSHGLLLGGVQLCEFETPIERYIQHKDAVRNIVDDLAIEKLALAQCGLSADPLQTVRRQTRVHVEGPQLGLGLFGLCLEVNRQQSENCAGAVSEGATSPESKPDGRRCRRLD